MSERNVLHHFSETFSSQIPFVVLDIEVTLQQRFKPNLEIQTYHVILTTHALIKRFSGIRIQALVSVIFRRGREKPIFLQKQKRVCQSEKSYTISIWCFPVRGFLLLFQILMSVPTEHTTVMLMLFVPTPWDPITARAKMDFMEMERTAPVTICNAVWFLNTSLTLQLKRLPSTFIKH